jgi:hypothetical protein
MSSIFYYSNYCEKCKKVLQTISKSGATDDIHFICIDNRVAKNSATYIVLPQGNEVLLPPTVNKVPALLLLKRGHHVLFGDDILNHLSPKQEEQKQIATQNNGEPSAFSLCSGGFGVSSDSYSFLDQDSESLSAKGSGGLRQLHHYTTLNENNNAIETPPDNYEANTIKGTSVEKLQQQRNTELSQTK